MTEIASQWRFGSFASLLFILLEADWYTFHMPFFLKSWIRKHFFEDLVAKILSDCVNLMHRVVVLISCNESHCHAEIDF